MDNAIQTAQDLATATARLDAYKDWFTILIGILSIAVVIALAACGTLIKNHVQTGIMKGAVEAQKTLDKNNEHEAKLLQLEDAIEQAKEALESARIQSSDFNRSITDNASRLSQLDVLLSKITAQSYVKMGAPPDSWEDVWKLDPGEYSWVQMSRLSWQPTDAPDSATRTILSVSRDNFNAGAKSCELRFFDGSQTLLKYLGEESRGVGIWARIATATPFPTEYDLPLAAGGFSENSRYYKNQIGEVNTRFCVTFPERGIEHRGIIATLPYGFRPEVTITFPITIRTNGSLTDVLTAVGEIDTTGNIQYNGPKVDENYTLVGVIPPFIAKP